MAPNDDKFTRPRGDRLRLLRRAVEDVKYLPDALDNLLSSIISEKAALQPVNIIRRAIRWFVARQDVFPQD